MKNASLHCTKGALSLAAGLMVGALWAAPAKKAAPAKPAATKPVTKPVTKSGAAQSFQTQPRDFLIYTAQVDGKAQPRFVVRADYLKYPANLSFRKFIPQGAPRTPEELYAQYVRLNRQTEAPFAKRRALYESKLRAITEEELQAFAPHEDFAGYREINLNNRFDVGSISLLSADLIPEYGDVQLLESSILSRQNDARSFLTEDLLPGSDASTAALVLARDKALSNQPPTDWKLPYKVQLPSPEASDAANLHPLYIFFDGQALNMPIEKAANDAANPILLFTHKVFQTYRIGTQKQWLDLWTPSDVKDFWLKASVAHYKLEREKFNSEQWRILFVMDLGNNAIVFLTDGDGGDDQTSIDTLFLVKRDADYKLTIGGSWIGDADTVNASLDVIVHSEKFTEALQEIAKQFAPQK